MVQNSNVLDLILRRHPIYNRVAPSRSQLSKIY